MDLKKIKRRIGLGGPLKPSESIGRVQARDSARQSSDSEDTDAEEQRRLERTVEARSRQGLNPRTGNQDDDPSDDTDDQVLDEGISARPEGQSDYDRASFLVGQFHGAWNRSGGTLSDSDFLDTLSDEDREAVTSYTSIGHDSGSPSQSTGYGEDAQTRQPELERLSPTGPDSVEMQALELEMARPLDVQAQDDRQREERLGYATDDVRHRGDDLGGLYQEMAAKGIRTERKRPEDDEERSQALAPAGRCSIRRSRRGSAGQCSRVECRPFPAGSRPICL